MPGMKPELGAKPLPNGLNGRPGKLPIGAPPITWAIAADDRNVQAAKHRARTINCANRMATSTKQDNR